MTELKSCPFCGGEAEVVAVTRHINNNLYVVKCKTCMASTRTYSETKIEDAKRQWNMRV